jgi:hypothetical protein
MHTHISSIVFNALSNPPIPTPAHPGSDKHHTEWPRQPTPLAVVAGHQASSTHKGLREPQCRSSHHQRRCRRSSPSLCHRMEGSMCIISRWSGALREYVEKVVEYHLSESAVGCGLEERQVGGVSRGVLQASESVGRKSAGSLPLEGLSLDNRRTEGRGANSRVHSLQRQEQASGTEGRWMEGRKSFSGRPSQTTPGKEYAYRGNDSRTVAQCGFLCFIYICNS